MSNLDPRVVALANAYGVSTEFWDWKGTYIQASERTVVECLRALDVDVDRDDWIDHGFRVVEERPWLRPVPPCVVVEQNADRLVNVHVSAGRPANVWVRLEDGTTFGLEQVDNFEPDRLIEGGWIGRAAFRLPTHVALGYHTLFLESDGSYWQCEYIVTPSWVGVPGLGQESWWGLMTQLYSMSGESSWGIGDFTDLADLAVWAKTQHGADYILINPVHAAEIVAPMEPSPYLPVTRRYTNPIYVRPEAIEEYASADEATRALVKAARERAVACTSDDHLDRDGVWSAKRMALQAIFASPRRQAREMEFEAYVAAQGVELRRFAVWCALTESYGREWMGWPEELRDPDSVDVELFAKEHSTAVSFHMWLQWVADVQAKAAQATAENAGMRVGVISDLAVGVNREGEETWADGDVFARGVTVGAPPDAYNQSGQDWQQPPWRPDKLEALAYAPLRDMVSAIMGHSGGLRVDHIIGLFRLWWVPDGMAPTQGAYVRYDHEAMVGVLALEAHRARAVVIGEDLGTVEPWARTYLAERGILGTSILWFENGDDGRPREPEHWRRWCLGSVTTHDLPPTLGYLAHDHVALRHRLGLLTESLETEIARDAQEQSAVLRLLVERGLIGEDEDDPEVILLGLHRFLYQTPAALKCVALTDAVGDRRTQNQPGTINEYPNWRVPLAAGRGKRLTLEQIYRLTRVNSVSDILNGRLTD